MNQPTLSGDRAKIFWLQRMDGYLSLLRKLVQISDLNGRIDHPAIQLISRLEGMRGASDHQQIFFHRFIPGLERDALSSLAALFTMTTDTAYWTAHLDELEADESLRSFIR